MDLYPAIDLRDGTAVRLTQGDFDRQQDYGDPVALAAHFVAEGAAWLHVVDLMAARTGTAHEREMLDRIIRVAGKDSGAAFGTSVQAGGGIRSETDADEVLALGAARVVLGTAALDDPDLAIQCARRWPGQVALGLDYSVGPDGEAEALGHGWIAGSGRSLPELLSQWEGEPFGAVVATSVKRDGMLEGPDLDGMRALLGTTAIPVVASGGVGTLDDLRALAQLATDGRRLAGVIVGKALVERRFSVKEALAACAASG
jgi:phosphoribosylformimino-5-aminoimidazole carboxamide ribotide isomerase